MRFLLLNQFYPPDPAPTGQYLHDLAQVLVARGHEVKVLCSRCSYDGASGIRRTNPRTKQRPLTRPAATISPSDGARDRPEPVLQHPHKCFPRHETRDGVEIKRLWATGFGRRGFVGKLADYVTFYGSLLFALLFDQSRPDLILSLTTPPYLGLLGKLAARRHGCRQADWVMDLYPDVMFAHGLARKESWMFRALQKLTRLQLRHSAPVIALGATMAQQVAKYVVAVGEVAPPIKWLPLWCDAALSPWPEPQPLPLRAERGWKPDEVVFLYSGNMGLGHRFTEFLEAARALGTGGPRWVFCGGGKRRAQIEIFAQNHSQTRIELLEYAPQARLREHLSAGDVHLMSLDASWQGFMVPSKLQASFAVGRPVIYVGGRDCETAAWIQAAGGGWVVDQNDLAGLRVAIQQALDPAERARRGAAARQYALLHFDRSATCNQMALMLEKTEILKR